MAKIRVSEKAQETGVAVVKGGLGAIPFVGSLLAELLGATVPNRRMNRVENMVNLMIAKDSGIDVETLKEKLQDEEFQDLFEKGVYAASKATAEERIRAVSRLMINAADGSIDTRYIEKYLLILESMDDLELIFLIEIGLMNDHRQINKGLLPNEYRLALRVLNLTELEGSESSGIGDEDVRHLVQTNLYRLQNLGLVGVRGTALYELSDVGQDMFKYIVEVISSPDK
jgi:hypothetical protein